MTTGILALIILAALLLQGLLALLMGVIRRRGQYPGMDVPSSRTPADATAWEGYREFIVVQRRYEDDAHSICSFRLAPADGRPLPDFRPGQFLTFKLDVEGAGTQIRCYSLSDRPHSDHYRISVQRVTAPVQRPDLPPGRVSNHFHAHVKVGSHLMLKAPSGHFHLIEEPPQPVVLIAGGIGITPMMSMLNALLEPGGGREVWLYYGVGDGSELIMGEHLRSLARTHAGFHLHLCFSRPRANDTEGVDFHHRGRVDLPLLRDTLMLGHYQFYVCGPRAMMESLVPGLQTLGVAAGDIHYESFGPASLGRARQAGGAGQPAGGALPTVTFSRSGRRVAWDAGAASILEFAEAQGVEVNSGCRAGSCGSCQTAIEKGEVEYSQTPDAEVAPGHCLLCISVPAGDLTLAL
ncbi:MAG: 2Fe-2S iron-sulfur cluster-binding protein [Candidatus Thiodiazotropha sp.]